MRRRTLTLLVTVLGIACTAPPRNEVRLWTQDYYIRVFAEPSPPRALEHINYRVVVQDRETRQPIESGEGRIFATNEDRKTAHNGFTKGRELGTYYTKLFFVTAGPWAMGIQFRRDSTQRLQQTNDWMQDVRAPSAPGQ